MKKKKKNAKCMPHNSMQKFEIKFLNNGDMTMIKVTQPRRILLLLS